MKIDIEIDSLKLKELVLDYLSDKINININEKDVKIKVRSQQNYRNREWEDGDFKATISINSAFDNIKGIKRV